MRCLSIVCRRFYLASSNEPRRMRENCGWSRILNTHEWQCGMARDQLGNGLLKVLLELDLTVLKWNFK